MLVRHFLVQIKHVKCLVLVADRDLLAVSVQGAIQERLILVVGGKRCLQVRRLPNEIVCVLRWHNFKDLLAGLVWDSVTRDEALGLLLSRDLAIPLHHDDLVCTKEGHVLWLSVFDLYFEKQVRPINRKGHLL